MDFNLNVNVKLDATPALLGAVSALTGIVRNAPNRTIEENKAVLVAEGPVTFTPFQNVSNSESESVKPADITDEQLRTFVGPKTKEHGKEKIFEILEEFNVKRVPDLKQDQRQEFIAKVSAL